MSGIPLPSNLTQRRFLSSFWGMRACTSFFRSAAGRGFSREEWMVGLDTRGLRLLTLGSKTCLVREFLGGRRQLQLRLGQRLGNAVLDDLFGGVAGRGQF